MNITKCKPLLTYIIYYLISCVIYFIIAPLLFTKYKTKLSIFNLMSILISFIIKSLVIYLLCSRNYMKVAWVAVALLIISNLVMTVMGITLIEAASIYMKKKII